MRFMMILIPKGYESATPDALPGAEAAAKIMEYNMSLQKAGVVLACDGLLPPSSGARISYSDGKATVTDGPFAEAKEVIGGYWIIQARSRDEAIAWFKRAPIAPKLQYDLVFVLRSFCQRSLITHCAGLDVHRSQN